MREHSAKQTTEYDTIGVEDIDQSCEADGEPPRLVIERLTGTWIAGDRSTQQFIDRPASARLQETGSTEQRMFADLGFPTPDGAAPTRPTIRVHGDVADFDSETRVAGKGAASDHETSPNADLARDEQQVGRPDARSEA